MKALSVQLLSQERRENRAEICQCPILQKHTNQGGEKEKCSTNEVPSQLRTYWRKNKLFPTPIINFTSHIFKICFPNSKKYSFFLFISCRKYLFILVYDRFLSSHPLLCPHPSSENCIITFAFQLITFANFNHLISLFISFDQHINSHVN